MYVRRILVPVFTVLCFHTACGEVGDSKVEDDEATNVDGQSNQGNEDAGPGIGDSEDADHGESSGTESCSIFPPDNPWNTGISS